MAKIINHTLVRSCFCDLLSKSPLFFCYETVLKCNRSNKYTRVFIALIWNKHRLNQGNHGTPKLKENKNLELHHVTVEINFYLNFFVEARFVSGHAVGYQNNTIA